MKTESYIGKNQYYAESNKTIQWQAVGNSVFFEVGYPLYDEGRFENLKIEQM